MQGGNISKLSEITGNDMSKGCYEYTAFGYTGNTREDFVALQLALDFEGFNPGAVRHEGDGDGEETRVADMNRPSNPAELNKPTDPAALNKPTNPAELNKPTDPAQLNKPTDPAELNKPTDPAQLNQPANPAAMINMPADPAQLLKKPGYSPILDSRIVTVGISNKPSKKTRNVTQVLYVK